MHHQATTSIRQSVGAYVKTIAVLCRCKGHSSIVFTHPDEYLLLQSLTIDNRILLTGGGGLLIVAIDINIEPRTISAKGRR